MRNLIANAIDKISHGEFVRVDAFRTEEVVSCTVSNEATEGDFITFQNRLYNPSVRSGFHGRGLVLANEFAERLQITTRLSYHKGHIHCQLDIPEILP